MKSSPTTSSKRSEGFFRYLKPGALAKLRDSKISARSHKPNSINDIFSLSIETTSIQNNTHAQISISDEIPCFLRKIYGPQCLRRKKLVACNSSALISNPVAGESIDASNVASSDSFVNSLNNDVLVH